MKILSIETSCDETAVSIVEAQGGLQSPHFTVLGNGLFSQVELHKEYGGVFPNLAKREHAKNLIPLLEKALGEANVMFNDQFSISKEVSKEIPEDTIKEMTKILEKENGLVEKFLEFARTHEKPEIDMIAVTDGPGLEPALWVGISFALALGKLWGMPVVPVNHMEGHICSVLLNRTNEISDFKFQILKKDTNADAIENTMQFPALALLISGGHTELVDIQAWGQYKVIGQTRDDAVGEAFDKVARLLGLPYPGGPQISKLAESARNNAELTPKNTEQNPQNHTSVKLPRPMIHSKDLDFSFSGLKTAVLYHIRDTYPDPTHIPDEDKMEIAREFEDAVVDVLLTKTKHALDQLGANGNVQSIIIAGGVIANKKIREAFASLPQEYPHLAVLTPTHDLATDNSVMIAMAGYIQASLHPDLLTTPQQKIIAQGNLKLGSEITWK